MLENKIVINFEKKIFSSNTVKAGVIGNPIKNSLSPKIHNFFIKKFNINGTYQAIEIEPADFESAINNLVNQGFGGFNVTIPFKEKIFHKCDFVSNEAKIIKAVNTVVIDENKKLHGFNSDAQGFIDNIFDKYYNFIFEQKNAFVIGAGGACRAIFYGLITNGVKNIYITNRDINRAQNLINDFSELAQKFQCNLFYLSLNDFENELVNCDILINSSSLGMLDQAPLLLNLNNLKIKAIVCDIVYKPLITNLLLEAIKRGNPIVTGIGMLIRQALVGFNMWYGVFIKDTHDIEKLLTSNKI